MMKFDSTCWAKATILGALFSVACNSSSSSGAGKNGDAGSGTGGSGATGPGGGGGAGGANSASGGKGGLGAGTGGGGVGNAGADGSTGAAGGTADGGVAAVAGQGFIQVTQTTGIDAYDATATFESFKGLVGQGQGPGKSTCTTSGGCKACVIPVATGDAGAVPITRNGLDAGAIKVTGAGASKATLTYGPITQTTFSDYAMVNGQTPFFTGGDSVSVTGAGGPDLPAFPAETVVAPSAIVLTAPVCTLAGCADVDRTKDMAVSWTGGGAGKVTVTLETLAPDSVTILTCDFDAAAGKGTVPLATLALLGKAGDPNISGVEGFSASNKKDFTVGDIPTSFELNIGVVGTLLIVSK